MADCSEVGLLGHGLRIVAGSRKIVQRWMLEVLGRGVRKRPDSSRSTELCGSLRAVAASCDTLHLLEILRALRGREMAASREIVHRWTLKVPRRGFGLRVGKAEPGKLALPWRLRVPCCGVSMVMVAGSCKVSHRWRLARSCQCIDLLRITSRGLDHSHLTTLCRGVRLVAGSSVLASCWRLTEACAAKIDVLSSNVATRWRLAMFSRSFHHMSMMTNVAPRWRLIVS